MNRPRLLVLAVALALLHASSFSANVETKGQPLTVPVPLGTYGIGVAARTALKSLVPTGWKIFVHQAAVLPDAVDWASSDTWLQALESLASKSDVSILVDWESRAVMLRPSSVSIQEAATRQEIGQAAVTPLPRFSAASKTLAVVDDARQGASAVKPNPAPIGTLAPELSTPAVALSAPVSPGTPAGDAVKPSAPPAEPVSVSVRSTPASVDGPRAAADQPAPRAAPILAVADVAETVSAAALTGLASAVVLSATAIQPVLSVAPVPFLVAMSAPAREPTFLSPASAKEDVRATNSPVVVAAVAPSAVPVASAPAVSTLAKPSYFVGYSPAAASRAKDPTLITGAPLTPAAEVATPSVQREQPPVIKPAPSPVPPPVASVANPAPSMGLAVLQPAPVKPVKPVVAETQSRDTAVVVPVSVVAPAVSLRSDAVAPGVPLLAAPVPAAPAAALVPVVRLSAPMPVVAATPVSAPIATPVQPLQPPKLKSTPEFSYTEPVAMNKPSVKAALRAVARRYGLRLLWAPAEDYALPGPVTFLSQDADQDVGLLRKAIGRSLPLAIELAHLEGAILVSKVGDARPLVGPAVAAFTLPSGSSTAPVNPSPTVVAQSAIADPVPLSKPKVPLLTPAANVVAAVQDVPAVATISMLRLAILENQSLEDALSAFAKAQDYTLEWQVEGGFEAKLARTYEGTTLAQVLTQVLPPLGVSADVYTRDRHIVVRPGDTRN